MAELGDSLTYGSTGEEDKVHVEMLDYGYIETCTDAMILRGIVKVLTSGKEGIYPEVGLSYSCVILSNGKVTMCS